MIENMSTFFNLLSYLSFQTKTLTRCDQFYSGCSFLVWGVGEDEI